MSGGETNPANTIAYTIVDAVSYAGLIVTTCATANTMVLAGASSDEPLGYTFSQPLYVTGGSPAANSKVGIHALIEGQKAEFKLPATHAAITKGDEMMSTASGCVIKADASGAAWILGRAEEGVLQNAGGYVEVRISKRYRAA
jgi:hypothetical protein